MAIDWVINFSLVDLSQSALRSSRLLSGQAQTKLWDLRSLNGLPQREQNEREGPTDRLTPSQGAIRYHYEMLNVDLLPTTNNHNNLLPAISARISLIFHSLVLVSGSISFQARSQGPPL